jgi:hypothetical protein
VLSPLDNDARLTNSDAANSAALGSPTPCKDGIDDKCLLLLGKGLLALLGRLISKGPGRVGFSWHKVHLELLASVLLSIQRTDSVEDVIRRIEQNIHGYVDRVEDIARTVNVEVPPTPFARFGSGALVLAPLLHSSRAFIEAFNGYIDAYVQAVDSALSVVTGLVETGNQIETDTPGKLQEIENTMDQMVDATKLDVVLKARYHDRIDFVRLDVMTKVQDGRSRSEDLIRYLQNALASAQGIQRL